MDNQQARMIQLKFHSARGEFQSTTAKIEIETFPILSAMANIESVPEDEREKAVMEGLSLMKDITRLLTNQCTVMNQFLDQMKESQK